MFDCQIITSPSFQHCAELQSLKQNKKVSGKTESPGIMASSLLMENIIPTFAHGEFQKEQVDAEIITADELSLGKVQAQPKRKWQDF